MPQNDERVVWDEKEGAYRLRRSGLGEISWWRVILVTLAAIGVIAIVAAWAFLPQPATADTVRVPPVPATPSPELQAQRDATPPTNFDLLCFPKPENVMCAQTPNGKFCVPVASPTE